MSEQQYRDGWNAAIDRAQEELVRQDQFSERTLRILDGQRIERSASVAAAELLAAGEFQDPHTPTREQIAKILHANDTNFQGEQWGDLPPRYRATLTRQALAVLALIQNGDNRG